MGSFLQALGALGENVGDAGQLRKQNAAQQSQLDQEKQRTGFEGRRVKNEDLRLLLEKQSKIDQEKTAALNRERLKQDISGYGWENALTFQQGDKYLQANTVTGERREIPKEQFEAAHLKDKTPAKPKYKLVQNSKGLWEYLPEDPTGPGGARGIKSDITGKLPRSGSSSGGVSPDIVAKDAKSVQSGAITLMGVPVKDGRREAVANYMRENGMIAKRKYSAPEQKQVNDINVVDPLITNMRGFIEKNNLQSVGEGGLLSSEAWNARGKATKAWAEYRAGLPPSDPVLGRLIQLAAALKIKGAAPLVSAVGRSKYSYEQIVQHLPETTDTPALLYKKVLFLSNLLDDSKTALGLNNPAEDATPPFSQPPGKSDPAVDKLLKKYNF